MPILSFKSMRCVYNEIVLLLYTYKSGKPIGTSIFHCFKSFPPEIPVTKKPNCLLSFCSPSLLCFVL